jgi:hypothetical protein
MLKPEWKKYVDTKRYERVPSGRHDAPEIATIQAHNIQHSLEFEAHYKILQAI